MDTNIKRRQAFQRAVEKGDSGATKSFIDSSEGVDQQMKDAVRISTYYRTKIFIC